MKKVKLLKEIQLYCRGGKHTGKKLGVVKFEEGREPYYYIIKSSSSDQLFRLPQYKNLIAVSTTILDDLRKLNVNKLIFYLCLGGGLGRDDFYIVTTRHEFERGELLNWDDKQMAIDYSSKIRHYEFPISLQESLKEEK